MPRFFVPFSDLIHGQHILPSSPQRDSVVTAENFPTSHFWPICHHLPFPPLRPCLRISLQWRCESSLARSIAPASLLPDSKIVIINQKTTACQPKRAHSTQKMFFPLKNIQILSTKKMRENSRKN